jgi:hypothetical protein
MTKVTIEVDVDQETGRFGAENTATLNGEPITITDQELRNLQRIASQHGA